MDKQTATRNNPTATALPPTAGEDAALEAMVDGYREGLGAWQHSCPCCFSEAHPEGLEAAVQAARG